ncbi:heptaprenyl diphosphate synthase component 1 [Halalkalibacter urbisdiaboli]|uniref:heptaprenyl diphosphate synthase component 1 n=1 Tax=Halalkalibacter urbisdiaboli TaxID=1960589 RepID=UPI000B435718|nr:heptaprenyl diphosphate synthase component 1 [Halalkalibacter urbisdiaboli]
MVRMNHFNDMVKEIKQSFYQLTRHPYIQKYVAEPTIDEDRLRFLYAMLGNKLPNKEVKVFTLSALLVQAALDVHEAVSLHKIHTDSVRKNRQLTVLAGDYYCSLYYYLLAEGKHLPMIRVYSHSIQQINELKMNVYESNHLSYLETQNQIASMESLLVQNIAEHFQLPVWKEVVSDFFYLKRLLFERSEWLEGRKQPIIEAMIRETSHIDEVLSYCEQKIEQIKDRLLTKGQNLQMFEGFLIDHVDRLIGSSAYPEKVAEEG